MRKPIIAGNWKMHKTAGEAVKLIKDLIELTADVDQADIVVCPPFTALAAAREALGNSKIKLGAQNMHWEDHGAFTGEISPAMLKDAGCEYVIVGHSERRQYFAETDETVNRKLKAAFAANLKPILCVGETLDQREAGVTKAFVGNQVREGLKGLSQTQADNLVIAYEPIWAIGTGRTASAGDANEVCALIRATVKDLFGADTAGKIRIQYGGSVKPDNIAELMAEPDIDGALVGGASLAAGDFDKIVRF